MNTLKILTISAVAFTLSLLVLCLCLECPLKSQYQNTVEKLMEVENINSEALLLIKFPELKTAKKYIEEADKLEFEIQSATGGPGVIIGEEGSIALKYAQREMRCLRNNAANILSQIYPKEAAAPAIELVYNSIEVSPYK